MIYNKQQTDQLKKHTLCFFRSSLSSRSLFFFSSSLLFFSSFSSFSLLFSSSFFLFSSSLSFFFCSSISFLRSFFPFSLVCSLQKWVKTNQSSSSGTAFIWWSEGSWARWRHLFKPPSLSYSSSFFFYTLSTFLLFLYNLQYAGSSFSFSLFIFFFLINNFFPGFWICG